MKFDSDYSRIPAGAKVRTLDMQEFAALLWDFAQSSVRVESYDTYNSPTDSEMLPKYRPGLPMPAPDPRRAAYFSKLKGAVDEGKEISRFRLLPKVLTSYIGYEIEWAYTHLNVPCGEVLRFVERDSSPQTKDLPYHDFYIFDEKRVVRFNFDEAVTFRGAELIEDATTIRWYLGYVDFLKRFSLPFEDYLKTFDPHRVNA